VHARYIRNRHLIDALHAQAFAALTASPGARAYCDELRAREIGHEAALRRVAGRLTGVRAEGTGFSTDDTPQILEHASLISYLSNMNFPIRGNLTGFRIQVPPRTFFRKLLSTSTYRCDPASILDGAW